MNFVHRARIAGILAVNFLTLSAPGVLAGQPVRTTGIAPPPEVVPAGLGCAFDVLWAPDGHHSQTEFDDGRTLFHGHGDVTLTNLDTETSFLHRARHTETITYDAATNEITVSGSGQVVIQFYPGDVGPWGVVTDPGALLRFTGSTLLTLDADTFVYSSFSYTGTVADVCAVLAS